MKNKFKIAIEVLLVIAAIVICIYNFSNERSTCYISSIVAICGTIALLIKDIVQLRKEYPLKKT